MTRRLLFTASLLATPLVMAGALFLLKKLKPELFYSLIDVLMEGQ